jgi:hypothetical protein
MDNHKSTSASVHEMGASAYRIEQRPKGRDGHGLLKVAALVASVVEPDCSNPRRVLKLYILASYTTILLA